MIKFLLLLLLHFILNKLCIKINFLIDKNYISEHKKKIINDTKIPLAGGFVFIIFFSFIQIHENHILLFSTFSLYVVGLMSDLNILASPLKRIIVQSLIILLFILITDLSIETLSWSFLDLLLNYKTFNVFFILFCLLILVNGFNFLDGINTLVVSNFIICLLSIFYLSSKFELTVNFLLLENSLIVLLVIYIYNFWGKSFLGDSGTYAISFLVGIICIKFTHDNYQIISPYFVACLLWYPALENLFSIIRRYLSRKNPSRADSDHLHHFLYSYIKKTKYIKNNLFLNTFTGILINVYLFASSIFSIHNFNNTKILILIISINIIVYLLLYYFLYKKIYSKIKFK